MTDKEMESGTKSRAVDLSTVYLPLILFCSEFLIIGFGWWLKFPSDFNFLFFFESLLGFFFGLKMGGTTTPPIGCFVLCALFNGKSLVLCINDV